MDIGDPKGGTEDTTFGGGHLGGWRQERGNYLSERRMNGL